MALARSRAPYAAMPHSWNGISLVGSSRDHRSTAARALSGWRAAVYTRMAMPNTPDDPSRRIAAWTSSVISGSRPSGVRARSRPSSADRSAGLAASSVRHAAAAPA